MVKKTILSVKRNGKWRVYEHTYEYSPLRKNNISRGDIYLGSALLDSTGNPLEWNAKPLWYNSQTIAKVGATTFIRDHNPNLLEWFFDNKSKLGKNKKLVNIVIHGITGKRLVARISHPSPIAVIGNIKSKFFNLGLYWSQKMEYYMDIIPNDPKIPRFIVFQQDEIINDSVLKKRIEETSLPNCAGVITWSKTSDKPFFPNFIHKRIPIFPQRRWEIYGKELPKDWSIFLSSIHIAKKLIPQIEEGLVASGNSIMLPESNKLLLPILNALLEFNLYLLDLSSTSAKLTILEAPYCLPLPEMKDPPLSKKRALESFQEKIRKIMNKK